MVTHTHTEAEISQLVSNIKTTIMSKFEEDKTRNVNLIPIYVYTCMAALRNASYCMLVMVKQTCNGCISTFPIDLKCPMSLYISDKDT